MDDINRRGFLGAFAGLTATWALSDLQLLRDAAAFAASAPPELPYDVLTPQQRRDFDALSAQFVPTTDTPGAREANVVRFMDRMLGTIWKDRHPVFNDIMSELSLEVERHVPGIKSFAMLSDAQQLEVMNGFAKSNPRGLFIQARWMSMVGVFAHPKHGGNTNKVGWKLIGFDDRHSWQPPFGYYDAPPTKR